SGQKKEKNYIRTKETGRFTLQLQIPRSVQTTVRKFKLFGCVTTLARFGRRPKLSPSDERKLLGTTKSRPCHELETGTKQEKKKIYGQMRQSLMYLATMPRHMFCGVHEKPLSLSLSLIYIYINHTYTRSYILYI
uniref:Uncharacterized protein n=1 Tax=Neolamprologus brichardi TaxID=32507 RepID=A0A3Q4G0V5_NEOBR